MPLSQNEFDETFGLWIEGLPYFLKYYRRCHVQNNGLITNKFEECSYIYTTSNLDLLEQYKLEGRNYYFIEKVPIKIPAVLKVSTEITFGQIVPTPEPIWCDLGLLICSSFTMKEWSSYLDKGQYCNHPKLCTKLGNSLANSLVKIASTRIFANPEQSILELPVNSIDAYNPSSSIGKFGMGFFSILFWLVGHQDRWLTINSYYREKGVNKSFLCTIIYASDKKLKFSLNYYPTNVHMTGTFILLDCSRDPFTKYNVEEFEKQIQKIKYTSSADVFIRTNPEIKFTRFNSTGDTITDKIFVQYNSHGIMVEDYATGISLEILLQKLFTPSISTKTIQLCGQQTKIKWKNMSRCIVASTNTFIILVNSVAVVLLDFEGGSTTRKIVLDLPPCTRVPVSRDDIIIDGVTRKNITTSLMIIGDWFLKTGSIYSLEKAVSCYVNYTSNIHNKEIFTEILDNILKQYYKNYLFINYEWTHIFEQCPLGIPQLFATKSNMDLLEQRLIAVTNYNTKIFVSKKVVILPRVKGDFTSAGTLSFIFVDDVYTKMFIDWTTQLSVTSMTDTLLPYSLAPSEAEELPEWIEPFMGKPLSNTYKNILKTVYS